MNPPLQTSAGTHQNNPPGSVHSELLVVVLLDAVPYDAAVEVVLFAVVMVPAVVIATEAGMLVVVVTGIELDHVLLAVLLWCVVWAVAVVE